MFEWIDRLLQVPPRQVQVDAGGFQVSMSQQHLDRAEVGAILQQVGGKAMPQHMRADALLEAGQPRGLAAGIPDGLVGNRVLAFTTWFAWEELRPWLLPAPVFAQGFQQGRADRQISIFTALAFDTRMIMRSLSMSSTARSQFAASHTGGVERHEQRRRNSVPAASIRRATSSGLSTVGRRRRSGGTARTRETDDA